MLNSKFIRRHTSCSLERLEARRLLTVHFTVNSQQNVHPISRFIYGYNGSLSGAYSNLTFTRDGGNRWTAYNWENNASNAGSDYLYQNDAYLGGGNTPGGAIAPMLSNANSHNAGALVTIPINGYVSADKNGGGDVHYTGNTWNGSTWVNGTYDPNYLQNRFKQELPRKGSAFTLSPSTSDGYVYQDEFVNWVKSNYAYGQTDPNRPIWFELDNEPDLWDSTHAEVHPSDVTFAEMAQKTIDYASAIKDVEPNTLVFGPASYGWNGYTTLQNAPDQNGRDFLNFYLQQMAQAQTTYGKRLVDVLDLHWYPEARGTNNIRITDADASAPTVAARLQAPRSLWDPTYTESSWITQFSTLGPINLLPREFGKINANYPGTKLAITEYNYGGGSDISGGIAQADVLGIFGRDGLFAADQWPLSGSEPFVAGAFSMFRNYDGANSTFGDTSIQASTDDNASSSIYASLDSTNPNVLTLVAINKTNASLPAQMNLGNIHPQGPASVYKLTSASSTPQSAGQVTISDPTNFTYMMLPYSVNTIRIALIPPPTVTNASFAYQTSPNTLSFTFSKDVSASLSSGDLTVLPSGGGSAIPATYLGSDASFTAGFSLPTPLPDGDYTATLNAAGIADGNGVSMQSNYSFNFFSLSGDANHNRTVDTVDFNLLASNFGAIGQDFTRGNFNYDNTIDTIDFNLLAANFSKSLPTSAPGPSVLAKGAAPPAFSFASDSPDKTIAQLLLEDDPIFVAPGIA